MGFEPGEAFVVQIRAAEVEFNGAELFGFLNGFPEQEGHASEVMEAFIRAAVLVNEGVLKEEGEDGGDGLAVAGDEVDSRLAGHAVKQMAEPLARLGWKHVAAPSQQLEVVEAVEEGGGAALFVIEALAFGTGDLPLDAALMEVAVEGVEAGAEVEGVEVEPEVNPWSETRS